MTLASHRLALAVAITLCIPPAAPVRAQAVSPSLRDPGAGHTGGPPGAVAANAPAAPASAGAPDAPPDAPRGAENPPAERSRPAPLTPIVPRPGDLKRPAFQLYAEIDLPVLTVGLVFVSVRFIQTQKAFCAPQCDPGDLNALDRTTAGRWSPAWRTTSTVGLAAMGVGAAALILADEGLARAANDAVVIGEAALSATAAASIMTIAAGRPRPFLYGDKAPLSERNGTDAANSFLSSHAAIGFAIATSTFVTAHRLHPRSRLPYGVLGVGLGAAGFVAASRVLGGQHFITDAIGGALVGSSVGVLIASIHGTPVSVVPVVDQTHQGLGIQGAF